MDATARMVGLVRDCLPPSDGLVVAVSGGPDSVALARAAALALGATTCPLVLAHLDHGLRGADGQADSDFVATLAESLRGVELCRERLDVGAIARGEGANLESVARRERYRWLAGVARTRGLGFVATGHTADDQAETVLHRLLRGTGLQGLRGIASRRVLEPGIEVVRPFLPATRSNVLAFLEALGQPYREDRTNRDLRLTRNRIRHELLPHLAARYNPAVASALVRLAAQAEEAYRDEAAAAAGLLAAAERPRAGSLLVFDRGTLGEAPRRVLRVALRLVWEREGWPRDRVGHSGWERLASFVRDGGRALELPGLVRARVRRNLLLLGNRDP